MQDFLIRNGDKTAAIEYIEKLDPATTWDVTVKKFVKNRTTQQNRLYWKWLGELQEQTGNDKDDLHVFFKLKFIGAEVKEVMGQKVNMVRSTTTLTTKEFTEYLQKIELLALDNDYALSNPYYYRYAMGGEI